MTSLIHSLRFGSFNLYSVTDPVWSDRTDSSRVGFSNLFLRRPRTRGWNCKTNLRL